MNIVIETKDDKYVAGVYADEERIPKTIRSLIVL